MSISNKCYLNEQEAPSFQVHMIDALLGQQPHSFVFYRSPAASRSDSCRCAVPLLADGVSDTLQGDVSPTHGLAACRKTEDIPTPGLTATPPPKGGQETPPFHSFKAHLRSSIVMIAALGSPPRQSTTGRWSTDTRDGRGGRAHASFFPYRS